MVKKILGIALTLALLVGPAAMADSLIFWNIGTQTPDKDIYEHILANYSQDPNAHFAIENVATQNDTYKEKLIIAMSSGECPDMYSNWSGGSMNEYIDAGFAQPLDDYIGAFKDKIMPAALTQGSYNGKVYAIPYQNVSISGVFYNTEMFERFGLDVPTTVSELEDVCDVFVENGITPFALANASKWTGSMYFMSLATRYGGLAAFRAAVEGTGSFEDECFVYAGQKIQEWVGKGYFPEAVNSLNEDDGQARILMYEGSAAMLLCGSWYTGTFMSDSPEFAKKISWFSFPRVDGRDSIDASIQIGTIGDQFISFNCTGERLESAITYMSHAFDEDVIQHIVDTGKIPPLVNAADLVTDPVVKIIMDAALNASSVQLWYDQYLPSAVAEIHKNTCYEIFGLTMTPEQANAELQSAMQAYIASKS